MSLISTLAYASSLYAFGLAVFVLIREAKSVANLAYGAGMAILGMEAACNGRFLSAPEASVTGLWEYLSLWMLALLPGVWTVFSLSYARGDYRRFVARWWWLIAASFALPLFFAVGFLEPVVIRLVEAGRERQRFVVIGTVGHCLRILFLLGAVVILMNLESTLRSSVGVMRWRIKFMVVGLGLLLLLRMYTTSRGLLQPGVQVLLEDEALLKGMDACALLAACLLMSASLGRRSLIGIDVYPSQAFLVNSLVIFLAGLYLVGLGVFSQRVQAMLPVGPFLVLVGVVMLVMMFLSERMRLRFKRLISRHFQRPFYDYRKVWMTFTQRTSTLMLEVDFCRAAVRWISDTFQLLSVTVWICDTQKPRLAYAASTSLTEVKARELLAQEIPWEKLVAFLKRRNQPLDIEGSTEEWTMALKRLSPPVFPDKGGNRVCVPLIAREELVGIILLGDRVSGMPFSLEDFDLLKCLGDQMAGGLLNIDLSRKLMQAKEMEAFQTMSAFFVHDLKNTASTLSLMLQNMQAHFDDPEFREDARRAVSRSVNHINDLITRLSVLRQGLVVKPVTAALHEVVASALENLGSLGEITLIKELKPVSRAMMDPELIHKVVANLVFNARDAVDARGEIRVSTGRSDGWVELTVTDNGCGMSPDFVERSLFKPFQTLKKKGIGIGMYHSKMIVEAHRGKIEVRSEPGKGTAFRVRLPQNPTRL